MTEPKVYLANARARLDDARRNAEQGMFRVAAREGYLAAFHAAQAVIMQARGNPVKTHSGVRTAFAEIARANPALDQSGARFLARSYVQKNAADYGDVLGASQITREHALDTIDQAARLIEQVAAMLSNPVED